MALDQLLRLVRVDIAHCHHRHQVGAVPVAIEALEGVILEVADDLLFADRQTLGIARTVEHLGQQHLVDAVIDAFADAQFLEHDPALAVEVGVVHRQTVGPVFQHLEALLHHFRVVGGDGQDVHSFVERGVGIEVGAKFDADRLQVRYQLVAFEIGGAVEGHVLGEVGQALLVVVFEHGTGFDHQPQFELVFGARVFMDVVSEAVGQLAGVDQGADGQIAGEGKRRRNRRFGLRKERT